MGITLTLLAAEKGIGPFKEVEALLGFTGIVYAAGGVLLDLTQLFTQTDPAGRSVGATAPPLWDNVESKAQLAGGVKLEYKLSTFTNPDNGTAPVSLSPNGVLTPTSAYLQIFANGTELGNGAVPNEVLSDRVVMKAVFRAQQ